MKLNEDIRVLTVHQPWAQCIAEGRKDYENRPEKTAKFALRSLRGRMLAIHGSQRWETGAAMAPDGQDWPTPTYGALLAVVTVGRVQQNSRYTSSCAGMWREPGEWGIELLNVYKLLKPIPLRGGQGWRRLMTASSLAWYELERQLREYTP